MDHELEQGRVEVEELALSLAYRLFLAGAHYMYAVGLFAVGLLRETLVEITSGD